MSQVLLKTKYILRPEKQCFYNINVSRFFLLLACIVLRKKILIVRALCSPSRTGLALSKQSGSLGFRSCENNSRSEAGLKGGAERDSNQLLSCKKTRDFDLVGVAIHPKLV